MGSTQVYHDPSFLREVWGLFAVGVFIIVTRLLVRCRTVGLRRFAGDDFMSVVVLGCYTADAITVCLLVSVIVFEDGTDIAAEVTITYLEGSNVDFTAEQIAKLTDEQVKQVIHGSRMQLLAWYTYTALM